MTITDITTLIFSIFFLLRGASRGFMNSLIVPFSIIVATVISVLYYQITADLIASLLIGLIGPLVLSLLLKFLLKTWSKATDTDIKPGFLSCLAGSTLTLIWGWVFIIFTLILLTVMPPWGETLTAIHNDVMKSNSYFIAQSFEETFFSASKHNVPAVANETSNNDAKSLAEDPRFQKVLQDPDIQKDIDAHDIFKLMKNPKMINLVQQIMSDPAAMKKVLTLYKSPTQPQANKN